MIDMPCCFTNTSVNKQDAVVKGSVQTYQIPSTEQVSAVIKFSILQTDQTRQLCMGNTRK